MGKGNKAAGTVVAGAAVAVKKDGTPRKTTKGLPRVTDKVLAGGDALTKYQAAVALLAPELQKECNERLAKAQTEGRKAKKVDFATIFNGRTVEELTTAKGALDIALTDAAAAEEANMARMIANMTAQLAALRSVKKDAVETAPETSVVAS